MQLPPQVGLIFNAAATHPNSDVDVVGVDLSPQVLADPLLAQELLEELGAVFEVVSADAPLPRLAVLDARGVVARAPLHPARAAGFGQRVGQRGGGHGQEEGGLLEGCVRGSGGRGAGGVQKQGLFCYVILWLRRPRICYRGNVQNRCIHPPCALMRGLPRR